MNSFEQVRNEVEQSWERFLDNTSNQVEMREMTKEDYDEFDRQSIEAYDAYHRSMLEEQDLAMAAHQALYGSFEYGDDGDEYNVIEPSDKELMEVTDELPF